MVALVVVSMSLGCTSGLGADVGTKLLDEARCFQPIGRE